MSPFAQLGAGGVSNAINCNGNEIVAIIIIAKLTNSFFIIY